MHDHLRAMKLGGNQLSPINPDRSSLAGTECGVLLRDSPRGGVHGDIASHPLLVRIRWDGIGE